MKTMHRKIKANNDNIQNMELTVPKIRILLYNKYAPNVCSLRIKMYVKECFHFISYVQ